MCTEHAMPNILNNSFSQMFLVHVNKFLHAMSLSERKKSLFYFSQVDFSRVFSKHGSDVQPINKVKLLFEKYFVVGFRPFIFARIILKKLIIVRFIFFFLEMCQIKVHT